MKYIRPFISIAILTTLISCIQAKKSDSTTPDKLEEITSRTDTTEGFNDIFLKIVSEQKTDSSHIYIAKGLYKGKTVGLQFEAKTIMQNGVSPNGEINSAGFIANAVTISSIGPESDEFVKALSRLYAVPTSKPFSKQPITATAFSLNDEVADLNKPGYYKFKLFFENTSEDLNSELYFHINSIEQIIELPEKDEGYRQPLINTFTK